MAADHGHERTNGCAACMSMFTNLLCLSLKSIRLPLEDELLLPEAERLVFEQILLPADRLLHARHVLGSCRAVYEIHGAHVLRQLAQGTLELVRTHVQARRCTRPA